MTEEAQYPALGTVLELGDSLGADPLPGRGHGIIVVEKGTRLIVDLTTSSGDTVVPFHTNQRGPGQELIYWGFYAGNVTPVVRKEYLPYPPADGIPISSVPDPVNQNAVGLKWRNVLSQFAHDVMAFNPQSNHLRDTGTHNTGHLAPTDAAAMLKNKATYQLGRAVTGVAFHRVDKWLGFDALQLAQYPELVPDNQNWKIWQSGTIPVAEDEIPIPNMDDMMAMICGDEVKEIGGLCVGAWVYLLNERIDASGYDSNMNSGGEIRLPDPIWNLWRPHTYLHRVTGTRSERADQWAEIMGWFRDAHDHYLKSVSPVIEHAGD